MDTLQDLLINKRTELNLSLREAGKLIGISHSYLNSLEKGFDPRTNMPINPTPDTLKLISKAYNLEYSDLMKVAGYIKEDILQETKLSEKDEKDIAKTMDRMKKQLSEGQDLLFNGEVLDSETAKLLLDAIEQQERMIKVINKKYIPKKYRED